MVQLLENSLAVPQNGKNSTAICSSKSTSGYIPPAPQELKKEGLEQIWVHPKSQQRYPQSPKGGNSPRRWMNGDAVATYNGILFRKDIWTQATTRMTREDIALRETSQLQRDPHHMIRRVTCPETESGMVAARGRGEGGMGWYCSVGADFQFCKMKSSGGGWGPRLHNRVSVPMPLNRTLTNGYKVAGAGGAQLAQPVERATPDLSGGVSSSPTMAGMGGEMTQINLKKKMAKVVNFTLYVFYHIKKKT